MYLGIDPGLTGGLVVLDQEGAVKLKAVIPTISYARKGKKSKKSEVDVYGLCRMFKQISDAGVTHAVMEKVSAMAKGGKKQGVSSMFSFGRTYGMLEACLAALWIPYTLVTPRAWTDVMHLGLSKSMDAKARSLMAFKRLFPGENLHATERSKGPHKGLIDALLLAEFCRRMFVQDVIAPTSPRLSG